MNGRGILAVAVLGAWGAGLATLAQRQTSRSAGELLAESAVRIAPGAVYFAVEEGTRHVGFASFTTDTIPDGLQFTEYQVRDQRKGNTMGRQVRQVVTRASRRLAIRSVMVSGGGAPLVTAIAPNDSVLLVVREGPSGPDTTRQRYHGPLLLPSLVPMAVALGESPQVGDRQAWDVFDPATQAVRRVAVTIRADSSWVLVDSAAYDAAARRWVAVHMDTVRAWHVIEDDVAGLDTWVDQQGRVVASRPERTESLRRTSYELAFENWRAGRGPDALANLALATVTHVRDRPVMSALTLTARGLPLRRLDANTEWQNVAGDTVRAVLPAPSGAPNGYWLPPHRDFRLQYERTLQVEPGVEVEAPLVVAVARRLRGRETDPVGFARSLTRWVSDSIRLEPSLTAPSGLTTLRSGAGDADHHTLAYLALARASGVPARAVRGLLRAGDHWLSHSWAEVFLGGLWLPVDPTSGQFPADAAHVRLSVGAVGVAPELDRLVSRASVTVVSSSVVPIASAALPRP